MALWVVLCCVASQVIIDSQPLTVAILASLLFGETIGYLGALGLLTGVFGLCLLEVGCSLGHGE